MALRPDLYNRLTARFGRVIIASEGEAMAMARGERNGRPSLESSSPGEAYRINCFLCGDTRHRLYINHMWGRAIPGIPGRNLHLAFCFNETRCLAKPGAAYQLYEKVFGDFRPHDDVLLAGEVMTSAAAEPPGLVYGLADLPVDHPAYLYALGRGFDPAWLSQTFGVGYVVSAGARFRMAHERLYIPVMSGGALVGWQARLIGGPPPTPERPKYVNASAFKKSRYLYNYDLARRHQFVVVCEGPTDVWRVGPEAVAMFGKSLSAEQASLLAAGCPSRPSWAPGIVPAWSAVVVLLDGDAHRKEERGTKQSSVDRVVEKLATVPALRDRRTPIQVLSVPNTSGNSWW